MKTKYQKIKDKILQLEIELEQKDRTITDIGISFKLLKNKVQNHRNLIDRCEEIHRQNSRDIEEMKQLINKHK